MYGMIWTVNWNWFCIPNQKHKDGVLFRAGMFGLKWLVCSRGYLAGVENAHHLYMPSAPRSSNRMFL